MTNTFISEGADIIFPVAGGVGLGAARSRTRTSRRTPRQARHDVLGGHRRLRQRRPVLQVLHHQRDEGHHAAVKLAVLNAANGNFNGGSYIGTLANGGAVLAPFHDFASKVPASLLSELNTIKQTSERQDRARHQEPGVSRAPGTIEGWTGAGGRRACSAGPPPGDAWSLAAEREAPLKLELRGITKRFGDLGGQRPHRPDGRARRDPGLLGENGAGKTTLMNVLYGLMQPDEGEILLDGHRSRIHSPKDAINAGIGMVHQHFMLVPVFTVAENVTLGMERTRAFGLLDRRRTRRDVQRLSERLRPAGGPRRHGRGPAGRRAAAGRDPQVPAPRRAAADPRRADRGADATARAKDLFRIMRELRGRRPVDHLHLAQAQGSAGDRRQDHGYPARAGGRRAAAHGQRRRTRRADGRQGGAVAGQQDARRAGRGVLDVAGT